MERTARGWWTATVPKEDVAGESLWFYVEGTTRGKIVVASGSTGSPISWRSCRPNAASATDRATSGGLERLDWGGRRSSAKPGESSHENSCRDVRRAGAGIRLWEGPEDVARAGQARPPAADRRSHLRDGEGGRAGRRGAGRAHDRRHAVCEGLPQDPDRAGVRLRHRALRQGGHQLPGGHQRRRPRDRGLGRARAGQGRRQGGEDLAQPGEGHPRLPSARGHTTRVCSSRRIRRSKRSWATEGKAFALRGQAADHRRDARAAGRGLQARQGSDPSFPRTAVAR